MATSKKKTENKPEIPDDVVRVLHFYADESHWKGSAQPWKSQVKKAVADGGARARAVLASYGIMVE